MNESESVKCNLELVSPVQVRSLHERQCIFICRYLQAFLDAYEEDGWGGSSHRKLKPTQVRSVGGNCCRNRQEDQVDIDGAHQGSIIPVLALGVSETARLCRNWTNRHSRYWTARRRFVMTFVRWIPRTLS